MLFQHMGKYINLTINFRKPDCTKFSESTIDDELATTISDDFSGQVLVLAQELQRGSRESIQAYFDQKGIPAVIHSIATGDMNGRLMTPEAESNGQQKNGATAGTLTIANGRTSVNDVEFAHEIEVTGERREAHAQMSEHGRTFSNGHIDTDLNGNTKVRSSKRFEDGIRSTVSRIRRVGRKVSGVRRIWPASKGSQTPKVDTSIETPSVEDPELEAIDIALIEVQSASIELGNTEENDEEGRERELVQRSPRHDDRDKSTPIASPNGDGSETKQPDVASPGEHLRAPTDEAQLSYMPTFHLAMKLNMLAGGANHVLTHLDHWKKLDTMAVGASVSHPPKNAIEKGIPSVSAVVATSDDSWTNFPASMRQQDGCKKGILELGTMMRECLEDWIHATGGRPKTILFYRTGVGEQDYRALVKDEYLQISAACAERGFYPDIVMLLIEKKQKTRFYPNTPASSLFQKELPGWFPPGLKVSLPFDTSHDNFYLQSHAGVYPDRTTPKVKFTERRKPLTPEPRQTRRSRRFPHHAKPSAALRVQEAQKRALLHEQAPAGAYKARN